MVVLVNAANSSATFQFAKLVKDNQLGTLVGQPTGGNQRGINGGAFFFATPAELEDRGRPAADRHLPGRAAPPTAEGTPFARACRTRASSPT